MENPKLWAWNCQGERMEIEENILRTVIEKESWEEIIYFIVAREKLDPWNIDLIKLTNGFIKFLRSVRELDFRIPAKVVFVAALLLRLKVKYLEIFGEEEEIKEEKEKIEIPTLPVKLHLPIKRFPKAQVTLEELIEALRKALEVEERRIRRRRITYQAVMQQIVLEEDIVQKMEKLLKELDKLLERFGVDKIEFRRLVGKWKRELIIDKLLPLLHLEQERKVDIEQDDFFKEILISRIR
jgi:segregation and condensation protein A